MDWRELWRLKLSQAVTTSSGADPPTGSETLDAAAPDAVRARFFFVVARTRMDLFLTIRRQFRDDRTVYVMLDRRAHSRRSAPAPVDFPDRRQQADRRRPMDYWEDPAHHPAVIIPVAPLRREGSDRDPRPGVEVPGADKETTMERGLVDETRMLAWVQEGRHLLQHVVPAVFNERDALRSQLQEATHRGQDLQAENDALRAEVARVTASRRQLEQGHAELVDSVGQFLTQLTQVLEPMRALADKLGPARRPPDQSAAAPPP